MFEPRGNDSSKIFDPFLNLAVSATETADNITPQPAIPGVMTGGAAPALSNIESVGKNSADSFILGEMTGQVSQISGDNSVGDVFTGAPSQVVEKALDSAKDILKGLSGDAHLTDKLNQAFDENWNPKVAADLIQEFAGGDFSQLPEIDILSGAAINSANGAFAAATDKIYLSQDFVAQNAGNVDAIKSVILEESGHFIDSRINTKDAAGDEGAIFSGVVQGKTFDAAELANLKAEDDSTILNLNGQKYLAEMSSFVIQGSVGAYYSQGNNASLLGAPISNEYQVLNGSGWRQDFEGGTIFHSGFGSYTVRGSVGNYYFSLGAENSPLGLPTSNEIALPNGNWRQNFQGGAIFHSGFGSYMVRGSLGDYYLNSLGGENSQLGLPTSNESPTATGARQTFERGYVDWLNSGMGTFTLNNSSPLVNSTQQALSQYPGQQQSQTGGTFEYNGQPYQWVSYVIQSGDNLSTIAQQKLGNFSAYDLIAQHNSIADPNVIYQGQVIEIPQALSVSNSQQAGQQQPQQSQPAGTFEYNGQPYQWVSYVIQSGDNLSTIAQQKLGNSLAYNLIAQHNGIADPNLIYQGQFIEIPQALSVSNSQQSSGSSNTGTVTTSGSTGISGGTISNSQQFLGSSNTGTVTTSGSTGISDGNINTGGTTSGSVGSVTIPPVSGSTENFSMGQLGEVWGTGNSVSSTNRNDYYSFNIDKLSNLQAYFNAIDTNAQLSILTEDGRPLKDPIDTSSGSASFILQPGNYKIQIKDTSIQDTSGDINYNLGLRRVNLVGDILNGPMSYSDGAKLYRFDGSGSPDTGIEAGKDTIVVIHGWNKDGESSVFDPLGKNIRTLATNAATQYKNDQVLVLDWKGPAHDTRDWGFIPWNTAGAIKPVADWALKTLNNLGIPANKISLFGHSLGAYLSAEIGKLFKEQQGNAPNAPNDKVFGVENLVAIDPAFPGAQYDINGNQEGDQRITEFKDAAKHSLAFVVAENGVGGISGDGHRADNANNSLVIKYDGLPILDPGSPHRTAVAVVADAVSKGDLKLENNPALPSNLWNLPSDLWQDQYGDSGDFAIGGTHEGRVTATPDGTIKELSYVNGVWGNVLGYGLKQETQTWNG